MGRRVCDSETTTAIKKKSSLPAGEILTDVAQKQWRIGEAIGCGSFGEIYLATDDVSEEATARDSRYVIKIEPHSNGPLFVEIHCLIRTGRHSTIKRWQNEKKLKRLGMPHYIANGSHVYEEAKYRFLVLPRYECDLEKILRSPDSHRSRLRNTLVLAAQIIDVLEYLHSNGYTHSDIKSSNLTIGFDGSAFAKRKCRKRETDHGRHSRSKIKYANYYYDEDFVLHNYFSDDSDSERESDRDAKRGLSGLAEVHARKSKMRKTTPADSRSMRMKGFFNLRKPKSDINYADLNSSICSYDSYQDLLENSGPKSGFRLPERCGEKSIVNHADSSDDCDDGEIDRFEEAVCAQSPGQVYLLDFGLASKFVNSDGSHKEFVMDQRKAHDGTLEYSSRDSHIGAHSRRSDLENLGYNILDWLTGNLPWKTADMLQDPTLVHAFKTNMMNDIQRLMETCFKSQSYPKFIEKYFRHLEKLEFDDKPDYRYCKNIFVNEFKEMGFGTAEDMVLNFKYGDSSSIKRRINYSKKINGGSKNTSPDFLKRNAIVKVYGRENMQGNSWENNMKMNLIKESLTGEGVRKPCVSRNFFVSDADLISKLKQTLLLSHDTPSKKFSPKNLRSTKRIVKKKKGGRNGNSNIGKFGNFLGSDKQYTWAEILAGNPENIIRKNGTEKSGQNGNAIEKNPRSRKVSSASSDTNANNENDSFSNLLDRDYLSSLNPTDAMREVVNNYKRRMMGKPMPKNEECDSNEYGYTPAMIKLMKSMKKRQIEEENEEKRLKSDTNKTKTRKSSKQDKPSSHNNNNNKRQLVSLNSSKRGRKLKSEVENKVESEDCKSVRSLRCRTNSKQTRATDKKTDKLSKKVTSTINVELIDEASIVKTRARKTRKCSVKSSSQVPTKRVIATRSRGLIKE